MCLGHSKMTSLRYRQTLTTIGRLLNKHMSKGVSGGSGTDSGIYFKYLRGDGEQPRSLAGPEQRPKVGGARAEFS